MAAGLLFEAPVFAQPAATAAGVSSTAASADQEAVALQNWRAAIAQNPAPQSGCFHVAYPDYVWEQVDCQTPAAQIHPMHVKAPAGAPQVAGNGNDYALKAQGLIGSVSGAFITSGITTEASVGVPAFGNGGILGSDEYSLQINTNADLTGPACAGHSQCHIWQQFVYATDYDTVIPVLDVGAGLFMQYWLIDWNASCPSGWQSSTNGAETDCFKNSYTALLPDIPISDLADVRMQAYAGPGGNDVVTLEYGQDVWSVGTGDGVLGIGSVWREAEFNVVGDGGGSQAQFYPGASITLQLSLNDGSSAAPTCVAQSGTTGETNNLNLGACQVGQFGISATDPYVYPYTMQFTESLAAIPPPVLSRCPNGAVTCKNTHED